MAKKERDQNNYRTAEAALAVLFCHCASMEEVTIGDFKAIVSRVCLLMDEAVEKAGKGK